MGMDSGFMVLLFYFSLSRPYRIVFYQFISYCVICQTFKSRTPWPCSCKTIWCWSISSAQDIHVSRTLTLWTYTSRRCRVSITSPTVRLTSYRPSTPWARGPRTNRPAIVRTNGLYPVVSGAQRLAATMKLSSPGKLLFII